MEVSKQNTKYLKDQFLKISATVESDKSLKCEESLIIGIGTTFELLLVDKKLDQLLRMCILLGIK